MKQIIRYQYSGYQLKLLDSLTKVFSHEEPRDISVYAEFQALRQETISFQVAYSCRHIRKTYTCNYPRFRFAKVRVETPIPGLIHLRGVKNVPCQYPAHPDADDNYLSKIPGLFPDRLTDLWEDTVMIVPFQWKSLWVDVDVPADAVPGNYPIRVVFSDAEDGNELCSLETEVTILEPVLPKQTFPRTEWFYADCLADYYGVPVFSEEHWQIMENFIRTATKRGINMILTPQFTPPLDTAIGRERTTVQLVDVVKEGDTYRFDFSKLERWVQMCRRCGVLYFEMSHLFSQWGAVSAPKVVGTVDGEEKTLFGWGTPATGGEYTRFLQQYLPQLVAKLKELGIQDCTWFHISDEPHLSQLESYRAARESVAPYLKGCRLMDALSDYEFYCYDLVETPVCATNFLKPFLEHQTEHLWTYYCTAQGVDVSNRFIAMPSGRTRIYGVQLYKFGVEGSLHWGYNFYNGVDSLFRIDPLQETDSGGAYPAGDPFLVYPKEDGTAEESIRLMLLDEAMNDLRALYYLESLTSREEVLAIVEEHLDQPLTFDAFPANPKDADYLFRLRLRINDAICEKWMAQTS